MAVETTDLDLRRAFTRPLLLIAISVILVALFSDALVSLDIGEIRQASTSFTLLDWGLASVLTLLSFWAISQYDEVATALLGLNIPGKTVILTGMRATAISQALGFGLITGSLVRWRLLGGHEVSLWATSKITAIACACFLGGWVVIASIAALLSPGLPEFALGLAWLGLVATIACAGIVIWPPLWLAQHLPSLRQMGQIIWFSLIDTATAAAVIYVFLPEGYVGFFELYSAFLLAFGLGMISGVPGGIGPFELAILALLGPADPEPLMASLCAYRLIYYVAPALIAGASLITPPAVKSAPSSMPYGRAPCPYAERGLVSQGILRELRCGVSGLGHLGYETNNTDIRLFDPYDFETPPDWKLVYGLELSRDAAQRKGKGLLIYKTSAKLAEIAKANGFGTQEIASEAYINPAEFTLDTPSRKNLRRKLRKFEKSQVEINQVVPFWQDAARIDAQWCKRNGGARGFSIGCLRPSSLRDQEVFSAWNGDELIAFITLHASPDRWVLDLVRNTDDCPDGTMHALTHAAIEAARSRNVSELSLCHVPFRLMSEPVSLTDKAVAYLFKRDPSAKGLTQFKSYFGPDWRAKYVIFDRPSTAAFGMLDTIRLANSPSNGPSLTSYSHQNYDYYEFASDRSPCDTPTAVALTH